MSGFLYMYLDGALELREREREEDAKVLYLVVGE